MLTARGLHAIMEISDSRTASSITTVTGSACPIVSSLVPMATLIKKSGTPVCSVSLDGVEFALVDKVQAGALLAEYHSLKSKLIASTAM